MATVNPALEAIWKKRVEEWKVSGKNVAQWSKENNIPSCQLYYWRDRFAGKPRRRLRRIESKSLFTEIKDDPEKQSAESGISISIQEVQINLSREFDQDALLRCLKTFKVV